MSLAGHKANCKQKEKHRGLGGVSPWRAGQREVSLRHSGGQMVLGAGHGEERQNLKLFLVKIFHLHRSGPLEAFFVNKTPPTFLKTRLGV